MFVRKCNTSLLSRIFKCINLEPVCYKNTSIARDILVLHEKNREIFSVIFSLVLKSTALSKGQALLWLHSCIL